MKYWAYRTNEGKWSVKEYNPYYRQEYEEVLENPDVWTTGDYEADNLEHATQKALDIYDTQIQDEITDNQIDDLK
jgi:hypothetical protein